ncbi:hypothetical protein ABZP36_005966 [Zizania latifolia]
MALSSSSRPHHLLRPLLRGFHATAQALARPELHTIPETNASTVQTVYVGCTMCTGTEPPGNKSRREREPCRRRRCARRPPTRWSQGKGGLQGFLDLLDAADAGVDACAALEREDGAGGGLLVQDVEADAESRSRGGGGEGALGVDAEEAGREEGGEAAVGGGVGESELLQTPPPSPSRIASAGEGERFGEIWKEEEVEEVGLISAKWKDVFAKWPGHRAGLISPKLKDFFASALAWLIVGARFASGF